MSTSVVSFFLLPTGFVGLTPPGVPVIGVFDKRADKKAEKAAKAAAAEARKAKFAAATKKNKAKEFKGESYRDNPLPPRTGVTAPATHTHEKPSVAAGKGRRNILITSALPYVNNTPHLGNVIGCVLSADVYARFTWLRGHNAVYVCGTDQYGTASETKAIEEGVTPKELCDKYHEIHKKVYDWFDISFDLFGKTTTDAQTKIAQSIFKRLHENDQLVEESVKQWFCVKDQRYLSDRFVEGTCPLCGYTDARGDQCDSCSNMLNAIDLKDPRCKMCDQTPEARDTKHLFLNLPKLSSELQAWTERSGKKGDWTSNAVQMTQGWFQRGLEPRCITRDLKWGTPVPADNDALADYKNKVFYVWFDAPIGYISITANLLPEDGADVEKTGSWKDWWIDGSGKVGETKNGVELVQFMAKDNVPFHTIVFPGSLLGTQDPWTMLHHISCTEYLNYENGKFSKSRRVGVFGDDLPDTNIPVEVWRYYLLANRPEQSDTTFTWSDFAAKNNNELLANLGNFVNRALKFSTGSYDGSAPPKVGPLRDDEKALLATVEAATQEYIDALEAVKLREGLRLAMTVSKAGNEYLQRQAPWDLIKKDADACGTVISTALHLVYHVATLLHPYMPSFSAKVLEQLGGLSLGSLANGPAMALDVIKPGAKLGSPAPIFRRINEDDEDDLRRRFGGVDFELDIRVGKVISCEPVEGSDKLLKFQIDVTAPKKNAAAAAAAADKKEIRQICGGYAKHYKPEELVGKLVTVLCNLKPVKLAGVASQGMILACAKGDEGLGMLTLPGTKKAMIGANVVPKGTQLSLTKDGKAKALLTKKTFDALVKATPMTVNDSGVAVFHAKDYSGQLKQYPLVTIEGWEVVADKSLKNGPVQ